jgi:hypothetical protein
MDRFLVYRSLLVLFRFRENGKTLLLHLQAASYSLGSEDDILFSYSPILASQHHPAEDLYLLACDGFARKPQR